MTLSYYPLFFGLSPRLNLILDSINLVLGGNTINAHLGET